MALIIPKCNAEPETLNYTLQVYYDANDWVSNSDLIDRLSKKLIDVGIESERKEPQSYTKKTQVLSYYGLIEWEDPSNNQSRRKITPYGKKLYELRQIDDKNGIQDLLVEILSQNTFGRNVLGCDSDSDLEAPNIFLKSSLLLGSLTNKEFAYILGKMELENMEFSNVLFDVLIKKKQNIQIVPSQAAAKWADPKPILALADWGLFYVSKDGASKIYQLDKDLIYRLGDKLVNLRIKNTDIKEWDYNNDEDNLSTIQISDFRGFDKSLLTAMRTKPFLLLAGISGTGKSRIVKQMAFESCPEGNLQADETSPGNYQLIEVKPNWHDSTELLGYESEIGGKHYKITPFVKFLVKAMCYPDVPFFVCMDEMNLAPVEQYFAEFLSVLESRKLLDDKKTITSESLIDADVFKKYEDQLRVNLRKKSNEDSATIGADATNDEQVEYGNFEEVYSLLKEKGLRLPSNLIVIGTVNMDETTHQFSRKVIDRAMTIEMNIEDSEDPFNKFFTESKDLEYSPSPLAKELFVPKVVQAKEAMESLSNEDKKHLTDNVPSLLHSLNQTLNSTPFKIAYRVQNELVLYFSELRKEQKEASASELLSLAMDAILMLKVLPRIEGDEDLLEKPLEKLHKFTEGYTEAHKKVEEMQARLNGGHFTSFWP